MIYRRFVGACQYALFLIVVIGLQVAHAQENECACVNPPEMPINTLLGCYTDSRCESDRKELEISLRAKGKSLGEAVEYYMQLANNPILTDEERKDYLARIHNGKTQIKTLKKLINFAGYDDVLEPLYIDFDYPEKGYHRHYYSFNLGYEYVSLDKIFQEGFPRIGFLIYRRYGKTPVVGEGLGYYGIHTSGSLQLTSSGELNLAASTGKEVRNTLQLTAEMYVPFFHSMLRLDGTMSDYIGVLFSYDSTKTQVDDHAKSRFYAGFRNAINPETFVDLLAGVSGTLGNNRIEIRTQLPVYKFDTGSRIFFGSIINMAGPWRKEESVQDVMRFYLHWNADFGKIMEGISSAVGI